MPELIEVRIPDMGDVDAVEVVDILVKEGDEIAKEDSVITLESDKASMDVPSSHAGTVKEIKVSSGDSVKEGDVVLLLDGGGGDASEDGDDTSSEAAEGDESDEPEGDEGEAEGDDEAEGDESEDDESEGDTSGDEADEPAAEESHSSRPASPEIDEKAFDEAYASPSVRKLARELGVDLGRIEGTGRKGRITDEDLRAWVKEALQTGSSGGSTAGVAGFEWPQMPAIDFTKFGEVEEQPLSRIQKVSKKNLHRSWLHVPHVTQHDEADTTELEAFRQAHKDEAKKRGFSLTPLAFLLKAAAATLREFPTFNASLHPDGDKLIVKKYFHIGVAVDTDDGLVVPVIRDVDQKGLFQLAGEVVEASVKAREKKLGPADFQGASFTISSLGGIGGTAFTPIVNAPEVAILGVSRHQMKPVWNGEAFEPRLMLPLSLSYDHRVIDGASAARFIVHLSALLSDLKRILL